MSLISIARPIVVAAAFGAVLASVGHFASLPSLVGDAGAQQLPASGIKNTKHNFGAGYTDTGSGGRSVISDPAAGGPAGGTTDTCVFCHTPHGSTRSGGPVGPLWNRTAAAVASLGSTTYNTYQSSTMQGDGTDVDVNGKVIQQPGDRSKLCLACHDGLLAINTVANAPGTGGFEATVPLTIYGTQYTASGGTLSGTGSDGYTRHIGTDLTNDHPIMVTMSNTTASRDTELRSDIDSATANTGRRIFAPYTTGLTKPHLISDASAPAKVQCPTCHDPHLGNVTVGGLSVNNKFLRLNRFQQGANSKSLSFPVAGSTIAQRNQTTTNNPFTADTDQICIACHTRLGAAWTQSAHANSTVAQETYGATAAVTADRNFPANLPVWRAGCLNCHDTHTKTGAKRLLREGAVSGKSAIEQTCYQCHSSTSVLTANSLSDSDGVPNIGTEFSLTYRMPITDNDQGLSTGGNTVEKHSIDDADFMETAQNLGAGSAGGFGINRHVECTDCHNPHRVIKADTVFGSLLSGGSTTRRTHVPARGASGEYGNLASGVLRGIWGVEPEYTTVTTTGSGATVSGTTWPENPNFGVNAVKKGDPGGDSTLPVGKGAVTGTESRSYVTREYQLCFKCHSSYANGPNANDFPLLKGTANGRGGTPSGATANGLLRYTNVAAEFSARAGDPAIDGGDQGEAVAGGLTPAGSYPRDINSGNGAINHRSWHPVVFPTGRTKAERGSASFDNIKAPFNTFVGTQTMHCSDCHGNPGSWTDGTGPALALVQGPHGSTDPFLLKGVWSKSVYFSNAANFTNSICHNCHANNTTTQSGFNGNHMPNSNMNNSIGSRCMSCHIAVPHGWKNKAFLVNKRCIGPEAGDPAGCTNRNDWMNDYDVAPYYYGARNSFSQWSQSRSGNYSNETATCGPDDGNGKKMGGDCK
jgi:predicted CXXCH cytochrome family protein